MKEDIRDKIKGALYGVAVGDARYVGHPPRHIMEKAHRADVAFTAGAEMVRTVTCNAPICDVCATSQSLKDCGEDHAGSRALPIRISNKMPENVRGRKELRQVHQIMASYESQKRNQKGGEKMIYATSGNNGCRPVNAERVK